MSVLRSSQDGVNEVVPGEYYSYWGIQVGTYAPESSLAPPNPAEITVLRCQRLLFATSDIKGISVFQTSWVNLNGESVRKIHPQWNMPMFSVTV